MAYINFPIQEITEEDDEDKWCTCICCNLPVRKTVANGYIGEPVQYTITARGDGKTLGLGLHKKCWDKNKC